VKPAIFFRLNVLLQELKIDQAANERGACLEALSTIMERYVMPNLGTMSVALIIVSFRIVRLYQRSLWIAALGIKQFSAH
jgi:hypothetical protein